MKGRRAVIGLFATPSTAVYDRTNVCGADDPNVSSLRMGISVGRGDRYGSALPDQYIDVTDLTSGNYRLYATADLAGQFTEARETSNRTWVDLKLTLNAKGKGGSKVRVIAYAPTP